ncbi:MAG TPA: DEAD/DEAH box helicase [Chitinophagales bacterium]|nr:DEAD/DEAH box helicase [Chitinophagales bacterium]
MPTPATTTVSYSFLLEKPVSAPDYTCFYVLKKTKDKNGIQFQTLPLDMATLDFLQPKLAKEVYQCMDNFTSHSLKFRLSEHTKFFKKQRSGTALDSYLHKAILRELIQYFKAIPALQEPVSLYHATINPATGNKLMAPCIFSAIHPVLSFEIIQREDNSLGLQTYIQLGEEKFPLSELSRNLCLLNKGNTYFILGYDDVRTLEWLEQMAPEKFAQEPAAFNQQVIQPLIRKYTVNNLHIFEKKKIEAAPTNCILLSEISSGAFLMLTPQWKYEDILIEGPPAAEKEVNIQGELYAVIRNTEQEQAFLELLRKTHPNFEKQRNGYFHLTYEDAKKKNWFLKFYHQMLAENVELIGMDMLQHFRYSQHNITTEIKDISTLEHAVSMTMILRFGDEMVSLSEVQKTLFNQQKSILLKDNTIGILDEEWLAGYSTLLKHGKIDKQRITVSQWLFISSQEQAQNKNFQYIIKDDWWQKWQTFQQPDSILYPVPATLMASLRPYQQKGYEWMRLLSEIGAGACLADDMGLGKTLQTIAFLTAQQELHPDAIFLVTCPASLVYNWQQELEKFAPSLPSYIHYGAQRNIERFMQGNYKVCITPYSTLRVDIDKINMLPWNTVVMDESHHIKNLSAQITKAIYTLHIPHKIALSGTPIMNNTFDLYAQLNFLLPNVLGGQEFFRKEYALPIDRNKNKEKMEALQQLIHPFVLRRTKKQVATDLPEKTELVLWCEMSEEQQEAYEAVKSRIRKSIFLNIQQDGLSKSKLNILQGIIKLRQLCCSPSLLADEEIRTTASVKLDVLMDELRNNLQNNKVLIFSQFKEMLHLIAQACRKEQMPYYHFDGDTAIEDRLKMVNEFQQEDNTVNIFLMSLKTGNAGLNLTAADYVFLVDPWWNSAIQQQAIDRTHRIGQTKNVFAYKMICKNTIEEKIIEMQLRKQTVSDSIITEDENFVKNLSQEDINYLFA